MIYNRYVCKEFTRVTETDCTYIAIYCYALFEFYIITIVQM